MRNQALGSPACWRLALVLLNVALASGTYADSRPNVLMILVDDLKPSFGAYGDSWVHSPNLDRLARRGVRFDRAFCNQAVCAPSRNNLLTGSRSTSLGVYGLSKGFRDAVPDALTLPQLLRRHDYHAAGVGKVFHIGHGNHGDPDSWSEPFHPEKVIDYALEESTGGQLTREEAYFSNQQLRRISQLPRGMAWERADVSDDAYADGRIAAVGIEKLRAFAADGRSFFLAVGFVKPHLPFCAPEKYWALYDDTDFPMSQTFDYPEGAPPYAGKRRHGELSQYKPIPRDPLDAELTRKLIHGYYAALSYMDAQLGKVLDELDRLGLAESTVVVLWGDHGFHLGDHGAWTKHTNYEEANRIPLVFAGPGVRSGVATEALVETVDVYPTIVDLLGLPRPAPPQPLDGVSLAPLLRGDADSIRDHAYHVFPRGRERLGRAIRTDRYRLVEWKLFGQPADSAEYELYDYVADPLETTNLARSEPEIVNKLLGILRQHPEAQPRGGKRR